MENLTPSRVKKEVETVRNYSENASKQYHTQVGREDVGRYVLLPGDPKRCSKIAGYFDHPRLVADSREYVTYTGTLDGVKVSVTSTGIGGPSAAIAIEELSLCGADTFLRVGTCGGMQPEVKSGDIVVATGAVRMEGTTREYAPIEYPAIASLKVVNALNCAAQELGFVCKEFQKYPVYGDGGQDDGSRGGAGRETAPEDIGKGGAETQKVCHIGVVQCKDSFFGQHEPDVMPVGYELEKKWEAWKKMGCLASEMESAAIYIVASRLRARAGTCLLVVANQEREKLGLSNPVVHDTDLAIQVSIQALRKLIRDDLQSMEAEAK